VVCSYCRTACRIDLEVEGTAGRNIFRSRVRIRKGGGRDELYELTRLNLKINLTKDFIQCLLLALLSYIPDRFKGKVPFLSGSRVVTAKLGMFLPTDTAVPILLCLCGLFSDTLKA